MGYESSDDVQRLVRVCAARGVLVSEDQAAEGWEAYSDDLCAGWMILPKSDDVVFSCIRDYLPGGDEVPMEDDSNLCRKCHGGAALPGLVYCLACTRETLSWLRQTIHRASHEGPLEGCRKNTCGAILGIMRKT